MKWLSIATVGFAASALAFPISPPQPASNTAVSTSDLQHRIAAAVPLLQQLLSTHPDVEAKLAQQFPALADAQGTKINMVLLQDLPVDLLSLGVGLLLRLPSLIFDGVFLILKSEYTLIFGIFHVLFGWLPIIGDFFESPF